MRHLNLLIVIRIVISKKTLRFKHVGPKDLGTLPISNNKPKGPAEEEKVRGRLRKAHSY